MRKKLIFAAAVASAALLALASCTKEASVGSIEKESQETAESEAPVFTATIAGPTKVNLSIEENVGKLSWEDGDIIKITDAANTTVDYKVSSIDPETGRATFVERYRTTEPHLGEGPYTATYGDELGLFLKSNLSFNIYMTAPASDNGSFIFTAQNGLMKIKFADTDSASKEGLCLIAVTGIPDGESEERSFTLPCGDLFRTGYDYFLALPAGVYTKIEIYNWDMNICTLKSKGIRIEANHIKNVTLSMDKIVFKRLEYLPGVFTVGAGPDGIEGTDDDKKVRFSRGNLRYVRSTRKWIFEDFQEENGDTYDSSEDFFYFYWGYSDGPITEPYCGWPAITTHPNDGDTLVNSKGGDDWGVGYCESNGLPYGTWRTMTKEEWEYLVGDSPKRKGKCAPWIAVRNTAYMSCVILPDDLPAGYPVPEDGNLFRYRTYPYGFEENYPIRWPQMQYAGAVCLPDIHYWTATSAGEGYAYLLEFNSTTYPTVEKSKRSAVFASIIGHVRLVMDVVPGRGIEDMEMDSDAGIYLD